MSSLPAEAAFALPPSLTKDDFTLRREVDTDLPFLLRLFASVRADEFAPLGWSAEQLAPLLRGQFDAQHRHYRAEYPDCLFAVIEHTGTPIGRLYLDEGATTLHLVDISLSPDWRGRGVGAALIGALQASARAKDKAVVLMVAIGNPARQLYGRLGFEQSADHGVYVEMTWRAPVS